MNDNKDNDNHSQFDNKKGLLFDPSQIAGAVSKEIKKQPVLNLQQAIQGNNPGVVVMSNSGNPGAAMKMRIRGANSLLGNNDPLYIVDGIPSSSDVNVNDIESVEILKDASSTAIFGSRGANGVVIITTKRGKEEKPQVQFTVNTGISNLAKQYDLMDAGAYAESVNMYKPNYFTATQIADYKKNAGVNWQDEITQTGITQDYQVSVGGGSNASKYYISANYLDQTGIILGASMNRLNLRSNLSTDLSKKLKLDLNITYGRQKGINNTDNGWKGSPLWVAPIFSPTFQVYNSVGQWNKYDNLSGPNLSNPLMVLKERNSDNQMNSVSANTKLSYALSDDLKFDVLFGLMNTDAQSGSVSNQWVSASATGASKSSSGTYNWTNSNIVTYHKNIAKTHDFTVVAVNEQSQFNSNGFTATGTDINPISVGNDNLGIANTKNISSYRSQSSLQSYLGRVSYSLLDRYLVTASYRADGTSKFQGDNKWGYFPSAAVAWRVTEEPFMKAQELVSNLKVRASWGLTGNQGIDAYATISKIGNMSHSFGSGSMGPGSVVRGVDNPDLRWETTAQQNFGVDVSVLNGKVNLTFDYYVKNTTDLLYSSIIPNYNGGGVVNKNIGSMTNKGYEVTVSATPVATKNFKWNTNFNISAYKNELVSLGKDTFKLGGIYAAGLTQESPFAMKVGESLGSFWGYEWQGVYKTSEATEAAKYGLKPGDNKYLDYDGDGKITSKDKHIIGNALPKFVWGFSNSFSYKNFDLNVMLQAAYGRKILNTVYASASTVLSDATTISTVDGRNFWTPTNDNALFANPASSTGKNYIESTQFLEDGSYVKVKNLALSYNLDRSVIKFADLKLTLSAQNLLTLSKYKGYDPESSTAGNDTDGAIDVGAVPNPRTVTFSLQLNL